jgi:hypothetical protein
MSLVALQLAHVLQCLKKNVWQKVATMAYEKMLAMAHDVTKQVLLRKQMLMVQLLLQYNSER